MSLAEELVRSEEFETEIFFRMARTLYADCSTQCENLFDITMAATNGFTRITPDILIEDSRIIKVLRYCMLPVISQMKLGQLVGIDTTGVFEENIVSSAVQLRKLHEAAPRLCQLFINYMDYQRFIWLQTELNHSQYDLAVEYAKKWTCSLIANQNSNTAFRNWRKELQESSTAQQAVEAGYTSVMTRRIITSINDILPGQYSRECRIQGRNVQKADIVVRLNHSRKLLLIEAKAIGVRIDAFKRIKECREKFDDWKQTFGSQVEVGVMLSGFMPEREVQSLLDEGAHVFWEHKEHELYDYLVRN